MKNQEEVPPYGLFVIIKNKNGNIYDHQCGGYACYQKRYIGNLIKIADDDVSQKLFDYFTGEKWNGWCTENIDEEDAKFIESIVPDFVVNRNESIDCCEAWVIGFYNGEECVLVWENSD